jgi:hypothetical protein
MKHKKTNLMKNTIKGSSGKNLTDDLQWKTGAIYKILNTLHRETKSGYRFALKLRAGDIDKSPAMPSA